MGGSMGCPSSEDAPCSSGGPIVSRRDLCASALQIGGCHYKVLDELLLGERRFVADMHTLMEVFYWPLVRWFEQQLEQQDAVRAAETNCPVSRVDIDSVFSNVDELIVFSRRLLPVLERARTARSKGMLVVFLQLATSFKVFDTYVAGWPNAMESLTKMEKDPPLAMFIRACELQERCGGSRLRDLLTMPLQRLTQYRLLVESTSETCPVHLAVLHHELARSLTLPTAVSEKMMMSGAPDVSGGTGGGLNRRAFSERLSRSGPTKMMLTSALRQRARRGDASSTVLPPRPKIKEGRLTKVCSDGPRSVRFVLFSDELFHSSLETVSAANNSSGVCGVFDRGGLSVERRGYDRQKQQQQQHGRHRGIGSIPLSRCFVIDDFEAPLHASFVVVAAHMSFLLQADSVSEKNEWVAALKESMDRCVSSSFVPATPNSSPPTAQAPTSAAEDDGNEIDESGTTRGKEKSKGGRGRGDHRESSTGGVATASSSYGGSSRTAPISASESSPLSSSPSLSSSSSPDGIAPPGEVGRVENGTAASDSAVDAAAAPAPAATSDLGLAAIRGPPASGGDEPALPPSSPRRRRSIRRPLTLRSTMRASYILSKGRVNHNRSDNTSAGGAGGGRHERGTWRKRKGSVAGLASRRAAASNSSSDRLAADSADHSSDHSIRDGDDGDDVGGGGRGGGYKPLAFSSAKQGNHGEDDGRFKPEECSFWVACGPEGKIVRWETLRLDAPLSDEAWNGAVGFRRALEDRVCFEEFRKLLRTRHASENLNFREAVVRYKALCSESPKQPKASSSAGARGVSASVASAASLPSAGGGSHNTGNVADTPSSFGASSNSDMALAAVARDMIIDRFVREGALEQVNLSENTREEIILQQQAAKEEIQFSTAETGSSPSSSLAPQPRPPSAELFAEAWDEVSQLLQRDAFAHFRNSEVFLRLKEEWRNQSNGVLDASEFVLVPSDGTDCAGAACSATTRASSGLAMVALGSPPLGSPPLGVSPRPTGMGEVVGKGIEAGPGSEIDVSARKATPNSIPKPASTPKPAPAPLPPFPPVTAATSAITPTMRDESRLTTTLPGFLNSSVSSSSSSPSGSSRVSPPSACGSDSSLRASIRSRLLSGLADHELQQYDHRPQSPTTFMPPGTSTVPRERTLQIDAAAAERSVSPPSRDGDTNAAFLSLQASPVQRVEGRNTAVRQPRRMILVPGAKGAESILCDTPTSARSTESRSSGGGSGGSGGGGDEDDDAWPWIANAPSPSPFCGERLEWQQQHPHCVMPPLPLAPSLRNFTPTARPPAPGVSGIVMSPPGAAKASTAVTTRTDIVGGARGVAESARHFVRNMGAFSDLSATIPGPIVRRKPPPQRPENSTASGEEQLAVEAVAWAEAPAAAAAAVAAERAEEEVKGEEEEKEKEDNKSRKESPSTSPPQAPPRLSVSRSCSCSSSTAATTPGSSTNSPSQGTGLTASTGNGRVERAARAYAAAAVARKAKQGGAKAMAAATKLSRSSEEAKPEAISTPTPNGKQRRPAERTLRRSPRHNKVQLLLQAPPGTGLGVLLADQNGVATVAGFRSSPDDDFDSVLGAGLRVGDVIVSANGSALRGNFKLAEELMTQGQENGELKLVVRRAQESPSPASLARSRSGERYYCDT